MTESTGPCVIYVAGYGRSGSTAFDMVLGGCENAIGVSELTHLFAYWQGDRECSCGCSLKTCPFWKQVFDGLNGLDAAELSRLTRKIESWPLWFNRLFRKNQLARYSEAWQQTFELISHVSGKAVVIDSSKSARKTTFRGSILARCLSNEFRLIHLVRDPRAVAFSYLRGNNIELEKGSNKVKTGGVPRVILSWFTTNLLVHMSRSRRQGYRRIRYEDLVADPDRVLQQIKADLDILNVDDIERRVDSNHGIAGNRIRRQADFKLKADESWKQSLTFPIRAWSIICWPLMKTYGYH